MSMRKQLILSVLMVLLTVFHLAAQTVNKISGHVKNTNGRAINAATVILYRLSDSALIKTEITDASGHYEMLGIKNGKYFVTASCISFTKLNSASFNLNGDESFSVPDLILTYTGKNLAGVTVVGNIKPMIEVKPDKTVFNIENSINATGSNAFELLQKSPGVVTDKDDNITLKGKNGVRIYIDGRPTQMSNDDLPAYLRSINSSDIELIEIISNPSAKYDAAGNAGIINIKLKKNKKYGFNGSVSAGMNIGKSVKAPEAFSFNYRNKKINIFTNYSFNYGNRQSNLFLYREQSDSVYDQVSRQNIKGWVHNIKGGFDIFLNDKSTIGFINTTNLNNTTNTTSGSTDISPIPPTGIYKEEVLKASNTIPGQVKNMDYNINYRYADTLGHELSIDADYGYYKSDKTSTQPNYYVLTKNNMTSIDTQIYWNSTRTKIDFYTAKLDYETPFKKGKLGFGGKFSHATTANALDFYEVLETIPVFDSTQSNRFNYKEDINAAYINYNTIINSKWTVQGGLRVENTQSTGQLSRFLPSTVTTEDSVSHNYTDFFPSAMIGYNLNGDNTFNLAYTRRIDRPSYQDLNPFEVKLDELTFQKGNAFLHPQYTNSIELTHIFKNKFVTTIGYSKVKDLIGRVIDTSDQRRSYITQVNLSSQELYNINFALPFQVTKWWNMYANINAYHSQYKGVLNSGRINVNLSISSYSLYLEQTFTLGKGFTSQLSSYYDGPSVWEGTFQSKPTGGVDIGFQKKLMSGKADVKLSCTDIFYTQPWGGTSNYDGAYIRANGNWESRLLKINFTYHFGNSQVKQARQRLTGSEEENKRTNSSQGFGGN